MAVCPCRCGACKKLKASITEDGEAKQALEAASAAYTMVYISGDDTAEELLKVTGKDKVRCTPRV